MGDDDDDDDTYSQSDTKYMEVRRKRGAQVLCIGTSGGHGGLFVSFYLFRKCFVYVKLPKNVFLLLKEFIFRANLYSKLKYNKKGLNLYTVNRIVFLISYILLNLHIVYQ